MPDAPAEMPFEIVLATGNPHKVQELTAIFASCGLVGVRLRSLREIGVPTLEPAETGFAFEDNATIKALSYAKQTGMLCLADDSGLEVDALGGRPGVISSHYCTEGREAGMGREERDRANNARVLSELADVPESRRSARFVCCMVLARGGDVLHICRGVFEGRIGAADQVPRGENGFGYDPLFLVGPDFARTGAELDPAIKNTMSHRARAAAGMADFLRRLS